MPEVLDEEQVAEVLQKLLRQLPEVLAALRELLHEHERAGHVAVDDRVAEPEQHVLLDRRAELQDVLHRDLLPRGGRELVEGRDRVPERPSRAAGDERERRVRCVDALAVADAAEDRDDLLEARPLEDEGLAPGSHRRDHLRELRGAEDEDEVGRGLFDQLQQGVPRSRRQLVGLVDDVDLVAAFRGLEHRPLADLAHLVDPPLGRGVHLDHVERRPVRDRPRDAGGRVEVGRRPSLGVQGLGEDARHRRLARAARAREQVRLAHLVVLDRVPQRAHDRLLPDHLREVERAIRSVQRSHSGARVSDVSLAREVPGRGSDLKRSRTRHEVGAVW